MSIKFKLKATMIIGQSKAFYRQIKIRYDLFNYLGSYRNIMQFQNSPRRKNK